MLTVTPSNDNEAVLSSAKFADCLATDVQVSEKPDVEKGQRRWRTRLLWLVVNLLERITACILLLILIPFFVCVGLLIVALSRRSPFVAHRRVGRNACELWVLKFRTMWGNANSPKAKHWLIEPLASGSELQAKAESDPRVASRFAAFCRRYSIDELPQLWHVIRGDMALIGPRPLTAQEIAVFYGSDASRLLLVRPGLSGLWQVNGRSKLSLEQRHRLDLFMLENWSLKLYVEILQATFPCVLSGRDAW